MPTALMERARGAHVASNAQQLRVYVDYPRRKIEAEPSAPELRVTEPGVGYRFRTLR